MTIRTKGKHVLTCSVMQYTGLEIIKPEFKSWLTHQLTGGVWATIQPHLYGKRVASTVSRVLLCQDSLLIASAFTLALSYRLSIQQPKTRSCRFAAYSPAVDAFGLNKDKDT